MPHPREAPSALGITDTPELEDLLKVTRRRVKLEIRTHVPAVVKTYNPATNTADVVVQIMQTVKIRDLTKLPSRIAGPVRGIPPNAEAPILPFELIGIPVQQYRTNAGYFTLPIAPGDTGQLHVNDRAIESWLTLGVPGESPLKGMLHKLKDAVFVPGLHPVTNPIVPPVDLTAVVIEGPQIKVGRQATSALIKGTEFVAAVDAAIAAAITAGAGSPGSGAAAFTAFQMTWNAAKVGFQSVKGKVE